MVENDLKSPQQELTELTGRLQKLMFLRLLFVSILLGVSIVIQIRQTKTYFGDIQTSHYFLIATIYFLTFIYLILYKTFHNFSRQAYFQLLTDTLFITAIIYSTGGIDSIFSFLYILTIINASIMLYRRGGMIIASSASLLYGLLLDLHYYNLISPIGERMNYNGPSQSVNIVYLTIVNIGAFYLVAFLSSYPSEQARKSRVELKAKEEDIVKLEALNDWIIRSIDSGLISVDARDRIILFNPAAEKIFAIEAENIIGLSIADALPFLKEVAGNESEQGYELSKRGNVDLQYSGDDGRQLYLRFFISPLRVPDGELKGKIFIFQDITEMRNIEEEMKKVEGLALTGELAAGIAHEIRNPMASISGSIQVLKEDFEKNNVNRRLMDIILREINRLNNLVNDFLLFARPKPADLREFNLNQLIMESIELFKNSTKWNERIFVNLDLNDEISLVSDPDQVKQVLWNVLLNAVDAMPGGGVIYISAGIDEGIHEFFGKGMKFVKIIVRDTGNGFNEKTLSCLFTPFFTTKEGGSGLGLAIVNRIVGGLKGKVSGRNHPDGGAEITIMLRKTPSPGIKPEIVISEKRPAVSFQHSAKPSRSSTHSTER
jgi:two-component system, NtrC family, sensor histidine kinase PilS